MVDRRAIAAAILVLLLSGCVGLATDPQGTKSIKAPALPVVSNLRLLDHGVELQVPVPVLLIGFPQEVANALSETAKQHQIKSNFYLSQYNFPLAKPPQTVNQAGPLSLLASFQIIQAPSALESAFFEYAQGAVISQTSPTIYDGNGIEDWLAANLPEHGLAPARDTPTFVLLHGGGKLADSHSYRYALPNGYLQPVRVFGEHHPLLVFDVSAESDPYVTPASRTNVPAYDRPMKSLTKDDASVLYELITHASHFRLLQGPLYPPSLKPCHGITLIQAYEVTSAADLIPGVRKSQSLLDKEGLHKAFSEVMAPAEVHLDVRVLQLPFDDPGLHANLRAGQSLRWWVDQNWDKYWVKHDGCEAYVSLLWHPLTSGGGGVAMYSFQDGRRFSLSSTFELGRAQEELLGTNPSRTKWDFVNMLYAHETGHLLGLRHPHDLSDPGGPSGRFTFSSIWSTMSYQQNQRISEFGTVEANNLHRNRAGYLLAEVQKRDADKGPAFEQGVAALSMYDWRLAEAAFEGILANAKPPAGASSAPLIEWDEHFGDDWIH